MDKKDDKLGEEVRNSDSWTNIEYLTKEQILEKFGHLITAEDLTKIVGKNYFKENEEQ